MVTTPGSESFANRALTRIVATLGPASGSPERIAELIAAGVDVFRINMAHGDRTAHEALLRQVRQVSGALRQPVGVLIDLAGPKIRLGHLFESPTQCDEGEEFLFVRGTTAPAPRALVSNYAALVDELEVGDKVLLADGAVAMVIIEKTRDHARARVVNAGSIDHRQGINLPGVKLSIPTLSAKDLENAAWAAEAGVDMVGMSFVREASAVEALTELLRQRGSRARVIAKIEKPEALENLEAIVAASGGVMVARGELGVEIDVAEIAVAQKRIIKTANRLGKPVIVATQMLDSMQRSRRPTRAEATDVATAILDGADACMLSGETAVGAFPRETVEMMNRIMRATEKLLPQHPDAHATPDTLEGVSPVTASVVFGAGRIAQFLGAKLVAVATRSGATALARAKMRDPIPTLAASDDPITLRHLGLFWGITALSDAPVGDPAAFIAFVERWALAQGAAASGDKIVFIIGSGLTGGGATNQIVVHEIA